MKRFTISTIALLGLCWSAPGTAQDKKGDVLIPSKLELSDEQKKDLEKLLDDKLTAVVKSCVAEYPRPEFFTSLTVQFALRKSGDLRGGYVPGSFIDPNLYVKSDEEKAKLEEAGSFTRRVVTNDRALERCLKKGTREFDTELDRYSAKIDVQYKVSWDGKKPSLEATSFEVAKAD